MAGLNDMSRCGSPKRLWRDIEMFADLVELMGRQNVPGLPSNTFNVARLPYPPKMCWLRMDKPPPINFKCHYARLMLLNDLIGERSGLMGLPSLDYSSMGTVWPAQSNDGCGPISDPTAWRESSYDRMLHLNDGNRILCNRRLISYFAELPSALM